MKGVSFSTVRYKSKKTKKAKTYGYYKSRIRINGKNIFIGHFPTAKEAAAAYQNMKERMR